MLLTSRLTQIGLIGFALLASVGCSSNASNTAVQPDAAATTEIATPESEVAPTQPPSQPVPSPVAAAPVQAPPANPAPVAAAPVQAPAPNPAPVAAAPTPPSQPAEAESSDPASLVQDFCIQKGQKVEQYFETNNFRIYLCYDNSNQIFYYGVDKRNGASIALPAYTEEGTGYVAENGEYDYIVTGASLSVYQNSKLILEETVIRSL